MLAFSLSSAHNLPKQSWPRFLPFSFTIHNRFPYGIPREKFSAPLSVLKPSMGLVLLLYSLIALSILEVVEGTPARKVRKGMPQSAYTITDVLPPTSSSQQEQILPSEDGRGSGFAPTLLNTPSHACHSHWTNRLRQTRDREYM
ncbi:MAG TPA: hypothetical protein DCP08_09120 [Chloroflexi bacterium]|nr:hypothetical protein [Chloroflexota bacterium]